MTVNHDVTGSSPVRGATGVGYSNLFFILYRANNQWHQLNSHCLLRKLTVNELACGKFSICDVLQYEGIRIPTQTLNTAKAVCMSHCSSEIRGATEQFRKRLLFFWLPNGLLTRWCLLRKPSPLLLRARCHKFEYMLPALKRYCDYTIMHDSFHFILKVKMLEFHIDKKIKMI